MLTVESNPNKFLDTEIIEKESIIYTRVYRKIIKLPIPWDSTIPKRHKRNIFNTELHRVNNLTSRKFLNN